MKSLGIIACLVTLFGFGGVCGFAVSNRHWNRAIQRAHWEEKWLEARKREDAQRLNLTPEQSKQLAPLYDQLLSDIRNIREEAAHNIVQAVLRQGRAMTQDLTPEQLEKFSKLSDERRDRWLQTHGKSTPTNPSSP